MVKAGQFLAVRGSGFIAEGIQLFEQVQERMECDLQKNEFIPNHIAALVNDKNGTLCVSEMLEPVCVLTPWEQTRYFRNEVQSLILELKTAFSQKELDIFTEACIKDTGKPYWIAGIACQIVYILSFKKIWIGSKGNNPKKTYTCAMQIATNINLARDGVFDDPNVVNPQIFLENNEIKVVGLNFDMGNMTLDK